MRNEQLAGSAEGPKRERADVMIDIKSEAFKHVLAQAEAAKPFDKTVEDGLGAMKAWEQDLAGKQTEGAMKMRFGAKRVDTGRPARPGEAVMFQKMDEGELASLGEHVKGLGKEVMRNESLRLSIMELANEIKDGTAESDPDILKRIDDLESATATDLREFTRLKEENPNKDPKDPANKSYAMKAERSRSILQMLSSIREKLQPSSAQAQNRQEAN